MLAPQDAICTLNTLQTNASCLEQVRRERRDPQLQLQAMKGFLDRAGLTVSYSSTVQKLPLGLLIFIKVILLPCSLSDVFYITGGGAGSSQYHSCNGNKGQGNNLRCSHGAFYGSDGPPMHLNCKLRVTTFPANPVPGPRLFLSGLNVRVHRADFEESRLPYRLLQVRLQFV